MRRFDRKLALPEVLELATEAGRRIADVTESASAAALRDNYFVLADNRT